MKPEISILRSLVGKKASHIDYAIYVYNDKRETVRGLITLESEKSILISCSEIGFGLKITMDKLTHFDMGEYGKLTMEREYFSHGCRINKVEVTFVEKILVSVYISMVSKTLFFSNLYDQLITDRSLYSEILNSDFSNSQITNILFD